MMLGNDDIERSEKKLSYIERNFKTGKEFQNLSGIVCYKKGDYSRANDYFRQALDQDSEYLPALRNLKSLIQNKKQIIKSA
jgi:tetratricopeptide (TPR) repeat protein